MRIEDYKGVVLWSRFCNELAEHPRARAQFLLWVRENGLVDWENFAAHSGRDPQDGALVLDAAAATSDAVMEGLRLFLDRLTAIAEARQTFEKGASADYNED